MDPKKPTKEQIAEGTRIYLELVDVFARLAKPAKIGLVFYYKNGSIRTGLIETLPKDTIPLTYVTPKEVLQGLDSEKWARIRTGCIEAAVRKEKSCQP